MRHAELDTPTVSRALAALLAVLAAGCATPIETLALALEVEGCDPGCELARIDLHLTEPRGEGSCVLRQGRVELGAADDALRLEGLEFAGARWGARALAYCADDEEGACPRCAGDATAALDVGELRVALAASAGCAQPPGPRCAAERIWLPAIHAARVGAMALDGAPPAGALGEAALFADLVADQRGPTADLDLRPSDDCYVRAGAHAGERFGDERRIIISNNGVDHDYTREGLLRFALADRGLTAALFQGADLRLWGAFGTNSTREAELTAYATGDDWRELEVTAASAPAVGEAVARAAALHLQYTELDVGAFARAELAGDGVASFRLRSSNKEYLNVASKEDDTSTKHPRLRVRRWPATRDDVDAELAAATFEVVLPRDGLWQLWARVHEPGGPAADAPDSFWIAVDDGPARILGDDGAAASWRWLGFRGRGVALGPLRRGTHRVAVLVREAHETPAERRSPRLDLLLLTDDPTFVPQDSDYAAAR